MTTTAMAIAANPAIYADTPEVFTFAWAEMKAARGQRMRPENMPSPMHTIIDETPLIDRIRAHARSKGYPLAGDRRA